MSRRLLLGIFALIVVTMVSIPFLSNRSESAIEITKVDPAFRAYVSAYTSGIISNESHIRIMLSEDYPGPITLDAPVTEKYFTFDPDIPGKTYWIDSRTIEFRPDRRLTSDQSYNVEFALSKLITDLPENLQVMKFSFRTMKQTMDYVLNGTKTIDKKTLRWQQLRGSIITGDASDNAAVEQVLSATQNGKKLSVKWEHETDHVTHRFTVDSISRTEKAGSFTMDFNGKPIGVDIAENKKVEVPSLKDFKVLGMHVEQGQEQCVVVQFSDPIMEKQDLNGLITIDKSNATYRYTVEDNDVKVYPSEHLTSEYSVSVNSGVKNVLGFGLPKSFKQTVKFEDLKPEIKLVGNGVILPNSEKGLLFPFQVVNLNAVDVKVIRIFENNIPQFLQVNSLEGSSDLYRVGKVVLKKKVDLNIKAKSDYGRWTTFSLDLGELIKTEPGAIYRVNISFRKEYSMYNCPKDTTTHTDEEYIRPETEFDPEVENGDEYGYYGGDYYDDYYWYWDDGDRDDPCSNRYYYNRGISRNVLASDLGLMAKRGNDGSMLFAVNDIKTTMPLSGVEMELYTFQNQLITSFKSDANGFATVKLPKKKPFLLVAKNGNQRGYLKLDDGSSLSLSAFDVAGQEVQKGIKGMIYGERGVWRPGDTLFLGFILEDKQNVLPETHPVTFELYNARGQMVNRMVKAQSVNGFYSFPTPTDPEAPTGYWMAKVKVGGAVFTKNLKVETIMPNRLKINMDFGADGLASKADDKITLDSKWLMGAPAKNLKAQVDISLYASDTKFKGYDNYEFDDPSSNFFTENQTVFDGTLDEQGKATFEPKINAKGAPGKLNASFNTRVFEQGGAFSIDYFTSEYSPYSHYVGLFTPAGNGWGGTLYTGKEYTMLTASVDETGKAVSRDELKVQVYKVSWRWWWSSGYDNLAYYINSNYYEPVMDTVIKSDKSGKGSFNIRVPDDQYGRYFVRVTDEKSGHSTGKLVWFDWPYWDGSSSRSNEAASLLQFSSDKKSYTVGETINLTIPSPGQGRALITVESGASIISQYWLETETKGNVTYTIPVTAAMSPNVYIGVTLIQPHAQTINDAPIRMYGVIPIVVDDPKTHISPVITTAEVWKPEQPASITVSETEGKPMTYTLAVVDEGLLDLTRFKTPDPWNHFYAREALGVKTWDMYDMVMGAYGAELERVLGIGGDGEG
ncbi:MAG TPA: MG2 domain-containing protein, partial [Bacteroidia bacterium]|nr:MG2 domain-containing protein [Bacteroidia bacterium]